MAIYEFRENLSTFSAEGQVISRNTSWTGMRFLLTEVSSALLTSTILLHQDRIIYTM